MSSRGPLPRKVAGLHAQELDGEFVVVDDSTQQAHALSGLAAELWQGIDTDTWPAATDEDLDAAVRELLELGLIEASGLSRRVLLARTGTVALAGAVMTIGLPSIAAAASVGGVPVPTMPVLTIGPSSQLKAGRQGAIVVTVAPATPGGATPTGTVTMTSVGGTVKASDTGPKTLVNGSFTFHVTNPALAGVNFSVAVAYSGDSNYLATSANRGYKST